MTTAVAAPGAAAHSLQVGGLTPFTSIDFPGQLAVLPLIDWLGLDIKASHSLGNDACHAGVTGVRACASPVRRSFAAVVQHASASGLPFECRTTAHPALLDEVELLAVADGSARMKS